MHHKGYYSGTMKVNFLNDRMKEKFGKKIYKLSLQTGCTCPNRDGTVAFGGCTFCSEGGSGDFASKVSSIEEQISEAKDRVAKKVRSAPEKTGYIAYFQSFTNTHVDEKITFDCLKRIFTEAVNHKEIEILSVATRPDCISEDFLRLFAELNRIKPVWIELGLQTIHEKTAERINRCYTLDTFTKNYFLLKQYNLDVVVHVILGLPGESEEDMLGTVRFLSELDPPPDGIKLQLLHVLEGTKLAEEYRKNPFRIMTMEEYGALVVRCLKLLPEKTAVHRITGDGPKKILIEPKWSANKKAVLNYLKKIIEEA